jgi:excisionase family DNA binding protein
VRAVDGSGSGRVIPLLLPGLGVGVVVLLFLAIARGSVTSGALAIAGPPVTPKLIDVLLAELDEPALAQLADRLAPYLRPRATLVAAQPDGWLTTKQAAAYLGITRNALHKLTAERTIPFEQDGPGCKCWFTRADLDAWRRGESTNAAKAQPRDGFRHLRAVGSQ